MKVLRTPEERFENLADYPYDPTYVEVDDGESDSPRWYRYFPTTRPSRTTVRGGRCWSGFEKPFLTAFSDRDPVTAGAHQRFQESVPGAEGQRHVTIEGAGHFLQEDDPEAFSRAIVDFCRSNPI